MSWTPIIPSVIQKQIIQMEIKKIVRHLQFAQNDIDIGAQQQQLFELEELNEIVDLTRAQLGQMIKNRRNQALPIPRAWELKYSNLDYMPKWIRELVDKLPAGKRSATGSSNSPWTSAEETNMKELEEITKTTPDEEIRICRRIEVGTAVHQGDVYAFRVADDHPKGSLMNKGNTKVAVGENEGSNHFAEGDIEVFQGTAFPDCIKDAPKDILGPVVVAKDAWCLSHPKHADHKLPKGTYQITYQLDYRTQQRVAD